MQKEDVLEQAKFTVGRQDSQMGPQLELPLLSAAIAIENQDNT